MSELDRDAVRLLSAWRVAVRELHARADALTAFGPSAVADVATHRSQLDVLHGEVTRTWAAWQSHTGGGASPETLAAVKDLTAWRRARRN